jgi:hypothetical protein
MVSYVTSKATSVARGYLRPLTFALLLMAAMILQARAEDGATSLPEEAKATVTRLLDAVRTRDADGAFAALSTQAQEKSTQKNPEAFITTLRLKQLPLYNHAQYQVLSAHVEGTTAIQRVELSDRDGKKSLAIIRLGRQSDGAWRIEGTVVIPPVSDTPCDCRTRGA